MPTRKGAGKLAYTGLFTAGLKVGIPYQTLVTMRVPVLVMMLDSQRPSDSKGPTVRRATQADIDAFARS